MNTFVKIIGVGLAIATSAACRSNTTASSETTSWRCKGSDCPDGQINDIEAKTKAYWNAGTFNDAYGHYDHKAVFYSYQQPVGCKYHHGVICPNSLVDELDAATPSDHEPPGPHHNCQPAGWDFGADDVINWWEVYDFLLTDFVMGTDGASATFRGNIVAGDDKMTFFGETDRSYSFTFAMGDKFIDDFQKLGGVETDTYDHNGGQSWLTTTGIDQGAHWDTNQKICGTDPAHGNITLNRAVGAPLRDRMARILRQAFEQAAHDVFGQ